MNVYIILLSVCSILRDPIRKGMLGFKALSSEKFDLAYQMSHIFPSRKNTVFF